MRGLDAFPALSLLLLLLLLPLLLLLLHLTTISPYGPWHFDNTGPLSERIYISFNISQIGIMAAPDATDGR